MDKAIALLVALLAYAALSVTLVGWTLLTAALVPGRVRSTARTLRRRPGVAWILGLVQFAAIFFLVNAAGQIKLLLPVVVLAVAWQFGSMMLGLTAFSAGLGRGLARLTRRRRSPLVMVGSGAIVMLMAGGFPWLGQLVLLMVALAGSGAALLTGATGSVDTHRSDRVTQ